MKFELASSLLLPFLAAAAPTDSGASAPAENPTAFTVMSSRSASPIHLLPMNAAGQSFWLGGEPGTYCPLTSGCPPGNMTVLAGNGGSLPRRRPEIHPGSFRLHPNGSSLGPFEYEAGAPGSAFGHYLYTGWGASGFMACPTSDEKWQVFAALQNATVPSGNVDDCLGFSALAVPTDDAGNTWQYI
ncbi:hypothetical protein ARAM_001193 [Aspergillus rambellii]|uniref:IgE-binding protein n=1 Tax=Aspergillus rambellii TaxID=308745 RepID=A0A0F8UGA5_9EURO|nr:hypothetical protein ARAM_001193 [Aspergillus rambellii]